MALCGITSVVAAAWCGRRNWRTSPALPGSLPFLNAISYFPEDAIDHQSTSNKPAGGAVRERATCPVKECLPGFLGFGDTPTDRKLISLKRTRA